MQFATDRFIERTLWIAGLFALAVIAALFAFQGHYEPDIFNLHFNAFALMSLAPALLTLGVIWRLSTAVSRSEEAGWFTLSMLAEVIFAGGEFMQRLSASPDAAIFWSKVSDC